MPKSALDAFLSNYPETVLQTLNDCARARGHDIYLVGGALRYMPLDASDDAQPDLSVDPFVATLGVGYRF